MLNKVDSFAKVYPSLHISAKLKQRAEDFNVEEHVAVELSGEGEHFWLHVEKTGSNTDWVAKQLARFAEVLDKRAVQKRVIREVGESRVATVLLARTPRPSTEEALAAGTTAWLAPYWSRVRCGPLVLRPDADGSDAEAVEVTPE